MHHVSQFFPEIRQKIVGGGIKKLVIFTLVYLVSTRAFGWYGETVNTKGNDNSGILLCDGRRGEDGLYVADTGKCSACENKNETECFKATNEAGVSDQTNAQIETRACQWMPYFNICVQPCHKRQDRNECEKEYVYKKYSPKVGGSDTTDKTPITLCVWDENAQPGHQCAPDCGKTAEFARDKMFLYTTSLFLLMGNTVGCVSDGSDNYQTCESDEYYSYKLAESGTESAKCGYKTCVGWGECNKCSNLPQDKKHGRYEPLTGFYIGADGCGWKAIRCNVGYGALSRTGCVPCTPGNYSDKEKIDVIFEPDKIPAGGDKYDTDACVTCTEDHYCDGKEPTTQQCPRARADVIGMKSKPGAKSKDECYIDKDTVFCDSKGCFTLPIGDKEILHSK